MPRQTKVPFLQHKIDILLRYDSSIKTRTDLANELGIHQSQISKWQSGGDWGPKAGNRIPNVHFDRILGLFRVSREWMEAEKEPDEPIEEWIRKLGIVLRGRPPRSEWQSLVLEAQVSDMISIRKHARFRGFVRDTIPEGFIGDNFFIDERIFIEVRPEVSWENPEGEPEAYLVMLTIERGQITCICPSEWYATDFRITGGQKITIPKNAPHDMLKVTGPVGVHSLIAIVTKEPFSSEIYSELMRPDHPDLRDCVARVSIELAERPSAEWQCFKKIYYIDEKP